ncbi:hypothetical protein ACFVRD_19560 [Streptomyces sp. NPDC057908]|uniref:hypothetical protein n=1 Tax=Streptomyces sp. NPDC057908 TaxID=3346276 RepID=UPI0036E0F109
MMRAPAGAMELDERKAVWNAGRSGAGRQQPAHRERGGGDQAVQYRQAAGRDSRPLCSRCVVAGWRSSLGRCSRQVRADHLEGAINDRTVAWAAGCPASPAPRLARRRCLAETADVAPWM